MERHGEETPSLIICKSVKTREIRGKTIFKEIKSFPHEKSSNAFLFTYFFIVS